MRKSRALRSALLCAAVLAGCARHDAEDAGQKAGTKPRGRAMTTAEVMEQVARAAYQPPADGQLTEKQVRQYLEVKRRAQTMRGKEQAQEPAVTADLRAALELGYNPKELRWIQERVMEAWIALRGQELDRKIAASRNQMIRDLEAQLRSATDPQQKRELEQQIAEIRAAAPLATEAPPSVGHNAALVRRYESEVAKALAEERGPEEARNGR
jgi:hypothetical protein